MHFHGDFKHTISLYHLLYQCFNISWVQECSSSSTALDFLMILECKLASPQFLGWFVSSLPIKILNQFTPISRYGIRSPWWLFCVFLLCGFIPFIRHWDGFNTMYFIQLISNKVIFFMISAKISFVHQMKMKIENPFAFKSPLKNILLTKSFKFSIFGLLC